MEEVGIVVQPLNPPSSSSTHLALYSSEDYSPLREETNRCDICFANTLRFLKALSVICYGVFNLMIFITTIIMTSDGGGGYFADNCTIAYSNTVIVYIVIQAIILVTISLTLKKRDVKIGCSVICIIFYSIALSALASLYSMRSENCITYMDSQSGINSPFVVTANQIILSCINIGICLGIIVRNVIVKNSTNTSR